MAVGLLNYTVADLCLGKPPLRRLSAVSSTVADALAALKSSASGDPFVSVWACHCLDIDGLKNQEMARDHHESCPHQRICVGRVCMVDVICYLCREVGALSSLRPSFALKAPVAVLLSKETKGLVRHVEPSSSLLRAIDLIRQGAQRLVVPIGNPRRKHHLSKPEYCWLGQEDLIRFIMNSIGLFWPVPTLSIESLNLISREFPVLPFDSPATSAIEDISRSTARHNSIAVVEGDNVLVGEVSPFVLSRCDETLVPAVMTLPGGDLLGYIGCVGPPPEGLVRAVEEGLREKNLTGALEELWCSDDVSSCRSFSSSDEECTSPSKGSRARMIPRAEPIACSRQSSLVAVLIQAIAHGVSYVWVVEEDCTVVGIVSFADILGIFREYLEDMV